MRLISAVKAYESWVSKSKSPLTAKAYLADIKNFVEFIGPERDSQEITPLHVSSFQDKLAKQGWSPRSLNRGGFALISFLETLGRMDIAHLVPTPVYEAKLPRWIPEAEVFRVIGFAERPLDRAILSVGYELAMRRGEIPLLNLSSYDSKSRAMKVHRLKHRGSSSPEYVLPMRDWACQELNEYLVSRQDRLPALFVTGWSSRINKDTVLDIYRRIAEKAGVDIPFHGFTKHSRITNYAIAMIREHGQTDLTVLSKFAGHKNPSSTLIYLSLASQYLLQR